MIEARVPNTVECHTSSGLTPSRPPKGMDKLTCYYFKFFCYLHLVLMSIWQALIVIFHLNRLLDSYKSRFE